MKLYLENFAKVHKATIDINGITLIAGENNTGKSTIGKVLYCLFECFYHVDEKIEHERLDALRMNFRKWIEPERGHRPSSSLKYINLLAQDVLKIKPDIYSNKALLMEEISNITQTFEEFSGAYEIESITDYAFKLLNMEEMKVRNNLINKYFDFEFNKQVKSLYINENPYVRLDIKDTHIELRYDDDFEVSSFIPLKNHLVYIENPQIIDNLVDSMYYYLRKNSVDDHERALTRMLCNSNTENLFDEELNKERFKTVLDKINKTVNGEFVVKDGEINFQVTYLKEPLRLSNLSTGLKSFVILKKLIESGFIEQNGLLILDEPEVHLHPKWQLLYAEVLVILQKEMNLNIVLTSHSPYFINAIEVFAAKHKIVDKCKYYLSDEEEKQVVFEDVTENIEKIYEKLASPLQELEDIMNEV